MPALQPLHAEGLVRFVAPGESAPASALKAFEAGAGEHPALLVTGDSALLTPAMVDGFCAGVKDGVDLCVGFAREETVAAAYPETRRTYLRFRDGGYSSCNLFALMTPQATRVLALWRDVTRHRKRPWRLVVAAFGWGALLRYMMGGLSLADAFAVASDFALAETILKARNAA